jgi:hypothetical protein
MIPNGRHKSTYQFRPISGSFRFRSSFGRGRMKLIWTHLLDFCNKYGNLASVAGFLLAIFGFPITLFRLTTIRRETERAKNEAREGLRRLGHQLLSFEIGNINHIMEDLTNAYRDRSWAKSIDKCHQLKVAAMRLIEHPDLDDEERSQFRGACDDLSLVMRYIEKNRITAANAEIDLPAQQKKSLDRMSLAFLKIESRLKHAALRGFDVFK